MYGTGRIHCGQSRSVNYRRAINRAETDPRASPERPTPLALKRGLDIGCWGTGALRPPWQSPAICLADFGTSTFLLVSLRSEQSCAVPIWEKWAASTSIGVTITSGLWIYAAQPLWPIWLSVCEDPAHGEPDLLTLPGASTLLQAGQLELDQQMGWPWRGSPSGGPAW